MRRAAAVLVALAAAAAPADAADFWVAAFGDSITEGCCDTIPARDGGYPERLAELWNCTYFGGITPGPQCNAAYPYPGCAVVRPGSCAIANRGISSERVTVEGVTRIDTVLAEWDWDVIVLMMGTNDLNLSTASIKAALATIDRKAADQGVDVVHAPIVELHPYAVFGSPSQCPGFTPRPWLLPAQEAQRQAVFEIAAARNRYLSDQPERLCPPDPLLDFHGHTRSDCFFYDYGEKCGVGHPSGSSDNPALGAQAWQYDGYDNMADGFYSDMVLSAPLPGAPVPTFPAGAICGQPASFDWTKESNETATWYQVEINGTLYDQFHPEWDDWHPAPSGACQLDADPDDSCALPSPVVLGEAGHTWRVRGRHPGGYGPWSAPSDFGLFLTTPPPVGDPQSPLGMVFTDTPPYRWGETSGASHYTLRVHDGNADVVDIVYGSSICAGGVCEATGVPALTDGDYTWRVRSSNGACLAAWSASTAFSIFTVAPAQPQPIYPTDVTFATQPNYHWTAVAGATEYDLWVFDGSTWIPDAANPHPASGCSSECSAQPSVPMLTPGARAFRVKARNPNGESGFGPQGSFTVLDCGSYLDPLLTNETVTVSRSEYGCPRITAGNLGAGDFVVQGAGTVLDLFARSEIVIHNGFRVDVDAALNAGTDR